MEGVGGENHQPPAPRVDLDRLAVIGQEPQHAAGEPPARFGLARRFEEEDQRQIPICCGRPSIEIGAIDVRQVEVSGFVAKQAGPFTRSERASEESGDGPALPFEAGLDDGEHRPGHFDVRSAAHARGERDARDGLEDLGRLLNAAIHCRLHRLAGRPAHDIVGDEDAHGIAGILKERAAEGKEHPSVFAMRVAALYDIHGNLPALEAVLEEVRREQVDRIVVGGDVVPGPWLRETLRLLLDTDIPARFIYGNGEVAVLEERSGGDPGPLPEELRAIVRWSAHQLDDGDARTLESWPKTVDLEVPGLGRVLFCHATPRNEDECFTRLTPEERLVPVFEDVPADVVVCGHTHMQFDRRVGAMRVVNAGSVGMPFGAPGADWLLLGPEIQLRHTAYDLQRAARDVRQTTYPAADEFAERYILNPPSAQEMLELFTRFELT